MKYEKETKEKIKIVARRKANDICRLRVNDIASRLKVKTYLMVNPITEHLRSVYLFK